MRKITETDSLYDHLERMSLRKLLAGINREDRKVPAAVRKAIPSVEKLAKAVLKKMKKGGRLFYIGAGTSGRLGIVDASECPPTYGVPHGRVIGLIAGGDKAIQKAVEFAEDDKKGAWRDLKSYRISSRDFVIGITASGTTPYVEGGLKDCRKHGIATGCITCNPGSPVARAARYPVVVKVGPEFVTGSTRMKSGTAQKLVLNMISTSVMIGLGHIQGNKMVDMRLSNNKLVWRGTRIIASRLGIAPALAKKLLMKHGSVRKALNVHLKK